jgi:hypothetical protein
MQMSKEFHLGYLAGDEWVHEALRTKTVAEAHRELQQFKPPAGQDAEWIAGYRDQAETVLRHHIRPPPPGDTPAQHQAKLGARAGDQWVHQALRTNTPAQVQQELEQFKKTPPAGQDAEWVQGYYDQAAEVLKDLAAESAPKPLSLEDRVRTLEAAVARHDAQLAAKPA